MVHLPVSKDGTTEGSLDKKARKSPLDGTTIPVSPASPGKKALEKPQKVLPCPRCESMNTKFCYYNNYSVNQPRHFCRQCQRYWTVGGTLRNVPVGGGSRKKNRHQRQEPYMRTGSGSVSSPLALATAGGQPGMANMGFQQLLTHDMSGFNFSQLPGFVPQTPYPTYPVDQSQGMYAQPLSNKSKQHEFQSMHPAYGAMNPQSMPPATGNYCGSDIGAQLQGDNGVNTNGAVGSVKLEFWSNMMPQNPHLQAGNHPVQSLWEESKVTSGTVPTTTADSDARKAGVPVNLQTVSKSGGYDSSMLLHLGLNTRPEVSGKPSFPNQNQLDSRGVAHPTNGSSPPHGSSTIEEEGSTPTNGYSNSGYEEGDTVSSMWQDMHDIHDIFQ